MLTKAMTNTNLKIQILGKGQCPPSEVKTKSLIGTNNKKDQNE